MEVVDIIADDATQLDHYQHTFADYQKAGRELAEMMSAIERNRENRDFLHFQFEALEEFIEVYQERRNCLILGPCSTEER